MVTSGGVRVSDSFPLESAFRSAIRKPLTRKLVVISTHASHQQNAGRSADGMKACARPTWIASLFINRLAR